MLADNFRFNTIIVVVYILAVLFITGCTNKPEEPSPESSTEQVEIQATPQAANQAILTQPNATPLEIGYHPTDQSKVASTPPSFQWMPEPQVLSYVLQISDNEAFEPVVYQADDLKYNFHRPNQTLASGKWYWRYAAVTIRKEQTDWSPVRTFTIPQDAIAFSMPRVDDLLAAIPNTHSRLLFDQETLIPYREEIREKLPQQWDAMIVTADQMLDVDLSPNDPPALLTYNQAETPQQALAQNRQIQQYIEFACEKAANLAFVSLITDENQYAQHAIEALSLIADWQTDGNTSFRSNPEMAPLIVSRMSRAYTWLHESLDQELKTKLANQVLVRGRELYQDLLRRRVVQSPYDPHVSRMIRALAEAGIVFHEDFDDSAKWFDLSMTLYYNLYPFWGGADGGYHNGLAEWNREMGESLVWLEMLNPLKLNIKQHPFNQYTGDLAFYLAPPQSPRALLSPAKDPITPEQLSQNLSRLAAIASQPYWWWYANQVEQKPFEQVTYQELLAALVPDFAPQAPDGIPQSKLFADVGIASLHTNLANPQDDIHFALKSSPIGTVGKNYIPNNAFELNAYGKPYLISSGFLDEYDSPHHRDWLSNPAAHNVVTVTNVVSGTGVNQEGKIAGHYFGDDFNYTWGTTQNRVGEISQQFDRHVFHLKPNTFILFDELEANQPQAFRFNLHSPVEISSNKQDRLIILSKPSGTRISLVTPINLIMENSYEVTTSSWVSDATQSHFSATIPEPREKTYFISVLQPTPDAIMPKLEMSYISAISKGNKIEIYMLNTDTHTIALTYNPSAEPYIGGYSNQYETNARLSLFALDLRDNSQSYGFIAQGSYFKLLDDPLFESDTRQPRFLNQDETQAIMRAAARPSE